MKKLVMLCGAVLFCVAPACGGGDDGGQGTGDVSDASDSSVPPPDQTANEGTPDLTPLNCDLPDLTGRVYRVTKLIANSPTMEVNPIWAADILHYDLVLLFRVEKHDPATGKLDVQVTSAWADKTKNPDGTYTPNFYQWALEPTVFQATLDGCQFPIAEPIALDIQTPTVSKPFHLLGITGNVFLSGDGSEILDCYLEGAINEAETTDLCLKTGLGYVSFHWFMNLAGICADTDMDGDGVIDSYFFSGHLAGKDETSLFKEGMHPITPPDGECKPDTEKCEP